MYNIECVSCVRGNDFGELHFGKQIIFPDKYGKPVDVYEEYDFICEDENTEDLFPYEN